MKASVGKRVLMLLENSTYPVDPRVRQEAMTLASADYQVSVICQRGTNQPWQEEIDGVFIYRYPAPAQAQGFVGYVLEYMYSYAAIFILSLWVWIQRGFDIIHAANPPDIAVFIAMFYKFFGKRFIFDHHDLTPEMYRVRSRHHGSSFVYRVLLWMEKISCRFADHVIATNQSYQKFEMQRGLVPENRITIVRNGPALDRIKLVKPDLDLKKRGAVIIGFIGVMAYQDGIDYLLRALHLLITVLGRKDFYCVMIGKGSSLAELKTLASKLELDPYVWFTGFIPDADMLRYMSTVDICLDPDPSNGFNDYCTMIKMMEYMAFSKPIVAFDLPEHRVTAGEAAMYATPNDELDFARQIAALMDDPELRRKMGEIGRDRVVNELAWPFQAKHLLDAYETIAANGRKDLRHQG